MIAFASYLLTLRRALFASPLAAVLVCGGPLTTFGHGALDQRILELNAALAHSPDDPALEFQLADVFSQHEDWTASLQMLDRVEKLAPGMYPTDFLRGRVAFGANRPGEAKLALNRFLTGHPGNANALLLRARAFQALGDDSSCLADYRAVLPTSLHPEPDLFQEVAEALNTRGFQDEALCVLTQGIECLGPTPSLVLKAMELELAARRFDAALSRVALMQASAPRPEPWMAKRAVILDQAGRREEARTAWDQLAAHLAKLPNLERGSHAMSLLAEQTQQALQRLSSSTPSIAP